jgi:hypothetical protein
MKKFGTPIGAGPGVANEKVGLDGVGTPLLVVVGGLGDFLGFLALGLGLGFGLEAGGLRFFPACAVPGLSRLGLCPFRRPEVGGVEGVCVVVVGVVDEVECVCFVGLCAGVVEVVLEVEVVCDCVPVVTVTAGVVVVTGGHDCVTLVIALPVGSGSELGGVPAATFSKTRV